uniref:Uncharacterized protein n=1 Tax=viral metagenome TaxID=1070528 RepID=A0A6C0IRC1_9ZZZZ
MPTTSNYINFVYVNLGFIAQIAVMMYFKSILEIKANWPQYRCNPTYWIFSDNISQDFNYCIQNTQMNMMGYLLQPMNYLLSSVSNMGSGFNNSVNNIRTMLSFVRDFVTNIIQSVFGVFLNLIIEFQKMIISIKDMVGKMIGIVVTIMYVLDGSIKTMNSAWAGPTGQVVRAIGSCFDPKTRIQTINANGNDIIYEMENIPLGAQLKDGGKVFSIMKIANFKKEYLYEIPNAGELNKQTGQLDSIFVTGGHFIFDTKLNSWIQIKEYKEAIARFDLIPEYFSCLITTNRHILIGTKLFWDWEDDELTNTGIIMYNI